MADNSTIDDDVIVQGEDATNARQRIRAILDGADWRLAVDTKISNIAVPIGPAPTIFKFNEVAVASRNKFDMANTTYTVPAGKTFFVTSFAASYDAQAAVYVRLEKQTGGTGSFETILRLNMMSGGQGNSSISHNLSNGIQVGAATDVFKITIDSSIAKGDIWAEYSGGEI